MSDRSSKTKKPSPEENEKFVISTSIITKRSLLPFIKGYSETDKQPWPLPYSRWNPHANIYYSFGEDTNPITRLKEIEKLKSDTSGNDTFQPHFPPPENPFLKRDPYSENEAKNKYLETQPVCFVIFGKPGLNTNKLAKMIAAAWNCVLISPETQIQEEIHKNSKNGQFIANILKSGESIGQEIIIKLIEERINQRDVKHRGYVIEGLPLIPNDSNLDYSSYPDHVNIPEDSDNKKFTTCVSSKHYPSSNTLDFVKCDEKKGSKVSQNSFDDLINSKSRIRECYECDIPRQIEDMFSLWRLKPQIIIYMVCPEPDIFHKRNKFFWNPHSGEIIDKTNEMIEDNKVNELDLIKAYEKILKEELIDESSQKHFVKRIVDMTPNINFQMEIYKRYALPTIDKIILKHNPQNIIRVDGRTSIEKMFQIVSLKLRLLPLPRVIVPIKMSESASFEINGEDLTVDRNQNFKGKTKEEIFEELSYRGAVSPRFRWRLSDWKFFCPVELAKGRRVEGDLKNAVRFMNCFYFLSSQEAEDSFIENPRPYLLPPNPRSSCKIAVIGPRYSGKTKLSNKLAIYLGGTVIDVQRIEDDFIEEQIQNKIAITKRENLDSVIRDVTKILQKEREERENKRLAELESWSSKVRKMLDRLKILKGSQEISPESSEEIENIRQTLQEYDIQFLEDDEYLQVISQDESMIEAYAPDYLKIEEQPVPELTEHDPEVVILLEDRVKFLSENPIKISNEDKVNLIFRNIEIIPSTLVGEITRDGGWILDNMYLDSEIWKGLIESGLEINDIIVLFEEAPYEYLIKNWSRLNDYEDDYEYDDEPLNMETGVNDLNEGDEELYSKTKNIRTVSEYIKTVKEFEKNLKLFQDTLKELGKEVLFYDLKNIDLFGFVSGYFNEYHPVASKMTEKEKEMESKDLGEFSSKPLDDFEEEEDVEEEEEDESAAPTEISVSDNRRLGDTSLYCPVALMSYGVFWKGQENLSALLANKIYLLSNKQALDEFVQKSNEFSLPWKEPLRKIPPLRVCIVGPPGSGKSTMAREISKECGLAHIDLFDKIDDYMLQLGFELVGWKQEDSFDTKDKEIPGEDDLEDLKTDEKSEDQMAEDLKTDPKSENLRDDSKSQHVYVIDKDVTESTIRKYRKEGGNLPDAMLKEILFKYFKPPFDECGVIFDSFPNCTQDVELILKKYAVPEIIIELRCSLELAQERLLPVLLESWKTKQDHKKLEEQKIYEMELEEFKERKEKWIKEKLRERRRKRRREDEFSEDAAIHTPPPSPASGTESEIALSEKATTVIESHKFFSDSDSNFDPYPHQTAADRVELEQLYLTKNPEPKIFSDWEEESSARRRMIRKIKEAYKTSSQNLRRTRDRMKKESIPWVEINSQIEVVKLFCTILTILDPYLHRNSSCLERSYEVSIETAEKLLDSGYYFLSSFGRNCPVQIYERKIPFHMFLPLEALGQIFPLLHRQYIYFLSGKEALESFKKDPLKYLNQDSCSPLIPVQISVIGPPKCGKTTLAQRFARTYGFKVITRGQSLRQTLEKFSWTDLALSIENNLREGNLVTDEQVARAIDLYSLDPRSSLGFVLDGFPVSQLEAEELALLAIKPMIVLDLEASVNFCLECLESDAEDIKKPSIFSPEFLIHQYQTWQIGEKKFRDWLSGFAANIVKIDATRNKWGVWTRADEVVRSRFTAIKKYFREADYDKVHHLEHLCISPYEFRKRESIYENFCPVCIQLDILKSSCIPLDRKGVFQFRDHFYWVCLKHVDTFAKDPLENLKKEMPADRSQILEETFDIEHSCWAKRLRSGGYCLVTYVESLPYRKIVPGKPDLALLYKDRLYLFCTVECRNRFMAQSSHYSEVEIQFQKALPPVQVKNLPNLGFLEQTVASLIIKAVNYLGVLRPKLLGHSASTTAAIYLGAYLKTHNLSCDLNEVAIYEEVIKRMEARSGFLRIVTRNMKNKVNPYVTLITEERKKKIEINIMENESLKENLEDEELYKLTRIASRTSQLSKQSSSVKFRRTSPTQILTDTGSFISSMTRRVPVPDTRYDYLCEYFKPASKVPAFLNVVDIAGLVKGAAEGQGLGNAFLSHISACDGIFHLCRAFEDDDVTHIEGDVNPVRDLEIISEELRLKDIEFLNVHLEKLEKLVVRGNDKKLKPEYETLLKVKGILVDDKNHIRFADWSLNDIEVLNKYLFLTSKPVIYLVNLSEKDYIRKKNKWLIKIKEWVDKNDPGAALIPFSGAFENKVIDMDEAERAKYYEESKVTSALDKIIVQGYKALQLQYFFTAGHDEVKAWTIQKGTKAPQAAGKIHTDFEKGFIMAEVMKFDDFKNEGTEAAVKAAGKYRQQGRNYVVEDGDIIFFKFNAGAGLKDPKKK